LAKFFGRRAVVFALRPKNRFSSQPKISSAPEMRRLTRLTHRLSLRMVRRRFGKNISTAKAAVSIPIISPRTKDIKDMALSLLFSKEKFPWQYYSSHLKKAYSRKKLSVPKPGDIDKGFGSVL